MKPILKYLLMISSIGLGSLTFFGFIAYQNSVSIGVYKQRELLIELTHQIFETKPDDLSVSNVKKWLIDDDFIKNSFITIIIHNNNKFLISRSGINSKVDINHVLKISPENLKSMESEYFIDNKLRYIWHQHPVDDTPYIFTIYYASIPDEQSFYIDYMAVPLFISAFIVLWVSLWGALILSNLFQRIEEQKETLKHHALHDILTGLPNRALFSDRIQHSFDVAKRDDSCFSLCMLDLDRFKAINDTLGHSYGDKLLIEVARRLEKSVRSCDTVSRFGGDEFAIILHNADKLKATLVAARISKSLKDEFVIDDECFNISGSLGISHFPFHGDSESALLSCSDIAMYNAKKQNVDYVFYQTSEIEIINEKSQSLTLFTDLKQAIESDQFEIHYQPKLDVKSGKITSMEALLRWEHPSKGSIPPDKFIILAEQTGLIRDITQLVIRQVFKDQNDLKEKGFEIEIAINLSAHDLYSGGICLFFEEMLKIYSIKSKNIVLEMTESAMKLRPSETAQSTKKLSEMGFIISIDDFGTGYSSLSNLQDLTVREIKIDRSFVTNMDQDENNARIVRSTIGLAHDLNVRVVAEGVETQIVADMLTELKCDKIQGYLIAKPQPIDQLLGFIKNHE